MKSLIFSISILLAGVAPLRAQTALTGGLQGTIREERSGKILPGVSVTLKQREALQPRTTTTDDEGKFSFVGLQPGEGYEIQAQSQGFDRFLRSSVTVESGEAQELSFALKLESVSQTVDVTSTTADIAAAPQEVSLVIDSRSLAELPVNGRTLNRFALLNPHVRNMQGRGADGMSGTQIAVNGASWRNTRYKVDGNHNYDAFTNSQPSQQLSVASVAEFKVLTNQFSAEHGNTAAGVVLTTTKSGTDQFHGEAFIFARPSGIQARPPLSSLRLPNQMLQSGGAVGGPLIRNRTHFFTSYEGMAQERGSFISSPRPDMFIGEMDSHMALARIDHRLTDSHTLTARINGNHVVNTNAGDGVGGLNQASTARYDTNQTVAGQVNDTIVRPGFVNEFRLSYTNNIPWSQRPVVSAPVITRPGYSTEGIAGFTHIRTQYYQAANQVLLQRGAHTVRLGAEYTRRKVGELSWTEFGSYTFVARAPRENEQPTQFSQTTGIARISYGQSQYGGFFQDDWRVHSRVTLNLGVRYEAQSNTDDRNNVAPRLGFAYDIQGDARTTLRGGAGIFFDEPYMHTLNQRALKNGIVAPQYTYTLPFGTPGFPTFPDSFDPRVAQPPGLALAARNLFLPANFFPGGRILNPYTSQFNLTLQRTIADSWQVTVGGIRSLGVKLFQSVNINPPSLFLRTESGQMRSGAEADRTRPMTTFGGVPVRQVLVTANNGIANYHGLELGIARRFSSGYQFESHYVLASAINTLSDDHNGANPNEWSDVLRAERGPSDFGQRQRLITSGLVELPWAAQFSGVLTLASGVPVNAITGVDNNGDTTVRDRPPYFSKNSYRGTRQSTLDLAVTKRLAVRENARIELRVDAYNVLNGSNFHRFNNVYGNAAAPAATFLQPTGGIAGSDPGRQLTFGARLTF